MLYSEFIEGTGGRDNAHNMKVYKDLEIMYMNSDMSKAEIYEYGKKLVDNRKSEETLRFEAELKDEIKRLKDDITWYKNDIARYQYYLNDSSWNILNTEEEKRSYKGSIKYDREQIKYLKQRIRELKWVLGA